MSFPSPTTDDLDRLQAAWARKWPEALAIWSKFTKLHDPCWCRTRAQEKEEHLTGSFAMIRLEDHSVVISLRQVQEQKLQDFALEILAHEIGHHVHAPGDLNDHGKMLARMRKALPTREMAAPMVANLYTDLLINDRLQRSARLHLSELYRAIGKGACNETWLLYMRIYEILWQLKRGTLVTREIDRRMEFDATLGARLIRAYAKEWLAGAGRFAALLLPYLLKEPVEKILIIVKPLLDTEDAAGEGIPGGLAEIDEEEEKGAVHPAEDEPLSGTGSSEEEEKEEEKNRDGTAENKRGSTTPNNRYREPIDYRDLLKSAGVKLSPAEMTIRYYRERAIPYLVPFPQREWPASSDPLPEGLQTWEFGMPLEEVDWFESVMLSPVVVPGVTTVQRTYGTTEGSTTDKQPLDLYIGVDCSGSMVNPQNQTSFPVLGGAIMAISALRAGAKVMVTLSGEPGKYISTNGFIRDEHEILKILTGYLGTGYTFGIPRLAEAVKDRKPADHPAHILIATDADIFMMLDGKSHGRDGWTIAAEALRIARGGGTYILHMSPEPRSKRIQRMVKDGWDVHFVTDWGEVVAFARAFSQKNYGQLEKAGG